MGTSFGYNTAGTPPPPQSGFLYAQSSPYNCDPTGTVDATAGLNALFADCATTGATAMLGPGTFLISSPLLVGNATTTVRSAPVSITGVGGMTEFATKGNSTTAADIDAVRAPTTLLAAAGFSGAEMMLVQGPGVFQIRDVLFQCARHAANGLVVQSANKSLFERLMVLQQNGGVGFNFVANDAWTGANGDEWHDTASRQLTCCSTVDNSVGLVLGAATIAIPINWSYCTFETINLLLNFLSPAATVGLQLQYADNCTFTQSAFQGTAAGLKIVCPGPAPSAPTATTHLQFPSGVDFYQSTFSSIVYPLDSPGGAGDPNGQWVPMNGAIGIFPYMQDNGEPASPYDRRFAIALEDGRLWSNARVNAPYLVSLDSTSIVGNTTTETAFAPAVPYTVQAGPWSVRGSVFRLRLSGIYNCTSTAGLTLRLRLYLDSVSANTLLLDSGALSLGTARSQQPWLVESEMTTVAVNAPGSATSAGFMNNRFSWLQAENGQRPFNVGVNARHPSVAYDTRAAHTFVLTAQWSLAEAGDSIGLDGGGTLDVSLPGNQPVG
ncbi:MAG TPA: hypothetical protein VGX96_20180 [Candidatus Elarobacter sp.]|nr:hypothetical protein [Candidatus Elarobacter sp.]